MPSPTSSRSVEPTNSGMTLASGQSKQARDTCQALPEVCPLKACDGLQRVPDSNLPEAELEPRYPAGHACLWPSSEASALGQEPNVKRAEQNQQPRGPWTPVPFTSYLQTRLSLGLQMSQALAKDGACLSPIWLGLGPPTDRAHRGHLPRAMRSTRMMRMMVGLMGRAAFISISSSAMPMMDRRTMAKSSWFHLASHG